MRLLYSLIWWVLLPFALFRLWWRGMREPGYRRHVGERLGFFPAGPRLDNSIWVHAVSVGETRAAEPLICALLEKYPQATVLLTHMTPTGRATGRQLFERHIRVQQAYIPYDITCLVRRFLAHFNPCLCILLETEIWPNLIDQCGKHAIPVVLANARLSQRSLEKGLRFASLMRSAADGICLAAAQTESDATRLRQFGSHQVTVVGSVKFDIHPPATSLKNGERLRAAMGSRPVLVCGSTREGEEEQILSAWMASSLPDMLLVLVPRHPQRFDEVARLLTGKGTRMIRRSQLTLEGDVTDVISADIQVLLGDSMGEMFAYYASADLVFVGGSLLPYGAHNLIEPCSVGKPVLIGPSSFNFERITQDAIAAGAALRVASAQELFQVASTLFRDFAQCATMQEAALRFASRQRGATQRTLELLEPLIPADMK
ncbi:MAG: lipid IV(A) 3-deoxy-D-manno-octulosonic acid transferase [Burkholderiaceae bacterium]|jgi:3-deoxy-D-manno-octulosonic-acid transferase|nr:lipid IV(A) 3-deoxy-D-manno-octulosonic acid transferase [Burkholderiaceae bacterium]